MECCGQDRTTKFCPDCGELVEPNTLAGLLKRVRAIAETRRLGAASYDVSVAEKPDSDGWKRAAEDAHRRHAKWQTWADELEKAITVVAEKENDKNETSEH